MNYRRKSNGLKRKQVNELEAGWHHARRIGYPLNAFITIRPTGIRDPSAFCALWRSIRNKLGTYARQHGFPFVAAWSRECQPDGSSEHLHVLMHMPSKHFEKFSTRVLSWLPEPAVVDVRPANQRVTISDRNSGLRHWLSRKADDPPSVVQAGPHEAERRIDPWQARRRHQEHWACCG
jgi:hypothetical protein